MFKCVWRCYRLIKHMNLAEEKSSAKILEKVSVVVGGGEPVLALPLTLLFGEVSLPCCASVSPLVR